MKRMLVAFVVAIPLPLFAASTTVLDGYRAAAKQEDPAFKDFSATRGETFYRAKTGDASCAACHGSSPREHGKHATTGKDILPMAPAANPERFVDAAKVEKWFRRNCNDVLKRACTANEKGDFISYLVSVQ
jgi:mono/diheme cytochrome c family protein